jgi:hypothetical protein
MVRTGPEARRLRPDADDLDAPTLISPQRVDRGFEKAFGERDVEGSATESSRPVAVELDGDEDLEAPAAELNRTGLGCDI